MSQWELSTQGPGYGQPVQQEWPVPGSRGCLRKGGGFQLRRLRNPIIRLLGKFFLMADQSLPGNSRLGK